MSVFYAKTTLKLLCEIPPFSTSK